MSLIDDLRRAGFMQHGKNRIAPPPPVAEPSPEEGNKKDSSDHPSEESLTRPGTLLR